MKKRIITISREFGSGGRTIGKQLAEKLGVSCYDKELIEKLAEQTGLAKKYIEEQGEYAPAMHPFSYAFVGRSVNGMSVSDYLWNEQRKKIQEIAGKEPCVIVGRCADYILRERDDVLNVFIHAPQADRAKRIVEVYGETETEPLKRLREKDKKRAINYKYYTEREWGRAENYHLTLDSSMFGIEGSVNLLFDILNTERER
ncbi:MAG: cytidylate kinase-like family protein [Lachnospiraceae bacterium]|nr:cytidylate kinase-like family protein [Lachnospiraceae bacterium]